MLYSLLWIGIGIDRQLFGDPEPFPPEASMALHNWFDSHDRAILWIGSAVIAMLLVMFGGRRAQWPTAAAYLALVIMPLLNVVTYFWSGLMWLIPGVPDGLSSSVIQFFVWTGVFIKIGIVDAGWDEDVVSEEDGEI